MALTSLQIEEARKKYGIQQPVQEDASTSYLSRVTSELKSSFDGLQKTTERGAELMAERKPIQGATMSGLGAVGGFIRGAFSPVTAAISPLIESGLKATGITENEKVQSALLGLDEWAKANPDAAENLKNVFEIAATVTGTRGVTTAAPAVRTAARTAAEIAQETAGKTVDAVAGAVKPIKETMSALAPDITRIPSRIATNIAEKKATEQAVKSLPTEVAQTAARDGVEIADVQFLSKIPATQKEPLRKLADITMKFAKGETKTNPIEVVGQPIVNRIKQLNSAKDVVGKKLGEVAKKLGTVTSDEIVPAITAEFKKIPGLSGVRVTSKGVLDFSRTALATGLTKSDRAAIQKAFTAAIKNGSGASKHKLRQELFEVLGGKKKSLANITDTQEKAFEGIRKGLSNILESKNSAYKTLSKEYATKLQPLADLRKLMKNIPEATEDILDMQAGLLARRLTSNSISGQELKAILKRMDLATKVTGKAKLNVENLQDFYNILNKYYDLAPKTGFQGQIKGAIESSSISEAIMSTTKGLAGETVAVRQKALENLLKEALR